MERTMLGRHSRRDFPMIKPPAVSTVHAVLDRNGVVQRRKRRCYKAKSTVLTAAHAPNGGP
jgi:hypothetical protein